MAASVFTYPVTAGLISRLSADRLNTQIINNTRPRGGGRKGQGYSYL